MSLTQPSAWIYKVLQYDRKIHKQCLVILLISCMLLLILIAAFSVVLHIQNTHREKQKEDIIYHTQKKQEHTTAQEQFLQHFLPTRNDSEALLQKVIDAAHQLGLTQLDVQYTYPKQEHNPSIAYIDMRLNYWAAPVAAQQFLYTALSTVPALELRSVSFNRSAQKLDQVQSNTSWRLLIQGQP